MIALNRGFGTYVTDADPYDCVKRKLLNMCAPFNAIK